MSDAKAENKTTDNRGTENETIHESSRERILDESKAEKEYTEENGIIDVTKVEKHCIDICGAEKESIDESNIDKEVKDNAQEITGCTGAVNERKALHKALRKFRYFADNTYLFLKRDWDISKQGSSEIKKESIKLPQLCSTSYTEAFHRYVPVKCFDKNSHLVNCKYRSTELIEVLKNEMQNAGHNETDSDFLHCVAVCFLLAFDLKEKAGFEDAPDCIVIALTKALVDVQYNWINELSDPDDDDDEL